MAWSGRFSPPGVEHFGDGIDYIHIVDCDDNGFPQILVTFDVGRDTDGVRCHVYGVNALMFIIADFHKQCDDWLTVDSTYKNNRLITF